MFSRQIKKNKIEILLAIAVFAVSSFFANYGAIAGYTDSLDFSVFNYNKTAPTDQIVIVALDEATINNEKFKSYKDISRADYAQVIAKILAQKPTAVGVDVIFFNESAGSEDLQNIIADNDNVVLAEEFDFVNQKMITPNIQNIEKVWGEITTTSQKLQNFGTVNVSSNSYNKSNIINTTNFILGENIAEITSEPFVIKLFRKANPGFQTAELTNHFYAVKAGKTETKIPLAEDKEENTTFSINFFSKPNGYETVSFYDLWKDNTSAEDLQKLQNKIVLIGDTASDAHDNFIVPTSNGTAMPGVEIHANALQTLLSGEFVNYQSPAQKTILLGLIALILLAISIFHSFRFALISAAILIILEFIYWIFAYQNFGQIGSIFWPIFTTVFTFATLYVYKFITEERQTKAITQTFSRYVSADVVKQIIENPALVNVGGESREVSILFSDLAGFTNISEKLKNEDLISLLNEYLDAMSKIILQFGGTIDKFMGDGIMSYLGAPLPKPNHEILVCEIALAQMKKLPEINASLKGRGLPEVQMRLGISSGFVTAGNIGTSQKLEYTLIGDEVNLASRLEGISKEYHTHIIMSENTEKKVQGKFFYRELDSIRVKGKSQPIRIFELLARAGEETPAMQTLKADYERGLEFYRKRNFKEAQEFFKKNITDETSMIMLERIKSLEKENLPENWDGVYTFTTK